MPLNDISTQQDIELLINNFYQKVTKDPIIGGIFNQKIENWEKHLPIMYAFWSSILFGTQTYQGNPMLKHIEIDSQIALDKHHFDQWLLLWEATVHEHFAGEKATDSIKRATNIANLMQFKIGHSRNSR
jgi:hemoglobin